jgi:peptidoglycan/xylan/chitin deacetylase (PgdA/CDA1 family)
MTLLIGLGFASAVAVLCWAILWRNSSILYKTFVRGDVCGNRVALTFDDGPHPDFTPRVLDILGAHGVKATFFCLGCLAEKHPGIVRRMHEEGHLVGNHGLDHSIRDFLRPPGSAYRALTRSSMLIRQCTGYAPRFYRPPVGVKAPPRVLAARRLGLALAGWSQQAADGGARPLSHEAAKRLVSVMRPGDVLLLHDGRISASGTILNGQRWNVAEFAKAFDTLLGGLEKKGLQSVRLDLLFGVPPGIDLPEGNSPG